MTVKASIGVRRRLLGKLSERSRFRRLLTHHQGMGRGMSTAQTPMRARSQRLQVAATSEAAVEDLAELWSQSRETAAAYVLELWPVERLRRCTPLPLLAGDEQLLLAAISAALQARSSEQLSGQEIWNIGNQAGAETAALLLGARCLQISDQLLGQLTAESLPPKASRQNRKRGWHQPELEDWRAFIRENWFQLPLTPTEVETWFCQRIGFRPKAKKVPRGRSRVGVSFSERDAQTIQIVAGLSGH